MTRSERSSGQCYCIQAVINNVFWSYVTDTAVLVSLLQHVPGLLQRAPFKDHDFKGLSTFASSLRSTVSTLFIGGFEDELKSQTTLQQVVSKLPMLLKDKWADYSFAITDHLPDIVDLDNWIHQRVSADIYVRAGMDSSTPAASRNQQEQKGGSSFISRRCLQ